MALDKTKLHRCPSCGARNTMMYVRQERTDDGQVYDVWWCAHCSVEGLVEAEDAPCSP